MVTVRCERGLLAVAGAVALLMSLAPPLQAQSARSNDGNSGLSAIEEVVVTARRREETAQSVPIPISAVTGEQLRDRVTNDLTDISRITPRLPSPLCDDGSSCRPERSNATDHPLLVRSRERGNGRSFPALATRRAWPEILHAFPRRSRACGAGAGGFGPPPTQRPRRTPASWKSAAVGQSLAQGSAHRAGFR